MRATAHFVQFLCRRPKEKEKYSCHSVGDVNNGATVSELRTEVKKKVNFKRKQKRKDGFFCSIPGYNDRLRDTFGASRNFYDVVEFILQ